MRHNELKGRTGSKIRSGASNATGVAAPTACLHTEFLEGVSVELSFYAGHMLKAKSGD